MLYLYRPVKGIRDIDWRSTQGRGSNPSFYSQFGMKGHNGRDYAGAYAGEKGVGVYSAREGIVIETIRSNTGYGNHVRVGHEIDGKVYVTLYAHLESIGVVEGQEVKAKQLLGIMGTTGISSGVHLHFGIREYVGSKIRNYDNGFYGYFNPEPYIVEWGYEEPLDVDEALVQSMIEKGYWNGVEGDGVTFRSVLLIAKILQDQGMI